MWVLFPTMIVKLKRSDETGEVKGSIELDFLEHPNLTHKIEKVYLSWAGSAYPNYR